jgi:hypothetical protein
MDNFYNSPGLTHFKKLKKHCAGTSCANRKNLPPTVKDKTLKKKEHCGTSAIFSGRKESYRVIF